MLDQEHIYQQMRQTIDASEKILTALDSNELDKIQDYDNVRVNFVRSLSKMKKQIPHHLGPEINKIYQLDKQILEKVEALRDEVLTEILGVYDNRAACVEYNQNKQA